MGPGRTVSPTCGWRRRWNGRGTPRARTAASPCRATPLRASVAPETLKKPMWDGILKKAGLDEAAAVRLYRLFTIGGYGERNVIPAPRRGGKGQNTPTGAGGAGRP